MKRIHDIGIHGEVSYMEFLAFQSFIDDIDCIKQKVKQYRYIDKADLMKLAGEFIERNP